MAKNKTEAFESWYQNFFLSSRAGTSPILISGSRAIEARFTRIRLTAIEILNSSDITTTELRELIAMKFFVTMRCAADYIKYASLILKVYAEWRVTNE